MKISERTAIEIRNKVAAGELTAVEAVSGALEQVKGADEAVNSFIRLEEDAALDAARAVDEKIRQGQPAGKLAGVPVGIKDNMCETGRLTTAGSKILNGFKPPYTSTAVQKCLDEGAVSIGKTNMDEFAMGSSCETSFYGPCRNPWDTERTPGGSSGGSAACVSAGFVPLSLGSDTGGSIRQPGAMCGVCGMKPTYGLVSRYGLLAYSSSLDQIGPFARNVSDAALLLEVISGHDKKDSTSVPRTGEAYSERIKEPAGGRRIGVPRECFVEGLSEDVKKCVMDAIDVFRNQGYEIKEIELPHFKYAIAAYYIIATAEASSNLARYDGVHYGHRSENVKNLMDVYFKSRSEGFGDEVKRRIMLGNFSLSSGYYDAYYLKGLQVRRLISRDYDKAFEEVDCIIGPTSPTTAFGLGEKMDDPLTMYLCDIYTIPVNLSGLPAISINCGFSNGLPVGLHLTGRAFEETELLRVAYEFESATSFHNQVPEKQGSPM